MGDYVCIVSQGNHIRNIICNINITDTIQEIKSDYYKEFRKSSYDTFEIVKKEILQDKLEEIGNREGIDFDKLLNSFIDEGV